jgi:hypothetical protein
VVNVRKPLNLTVGCGECSQNVRIPGLKRCGFTAPQVIFP